jgi:hypothetical protein
MAFTYPRTWEVGENVTTAMLNEQLRDNQLVMHDDVRTWYPRPIFPVVGAMAAQALAANNTEAAINCHHLARRIVVTKIQYYLSAGGGANSVVRIALYTEDGQTKLIDVTDACGAATGIRSIAVASVTLEPDNYYSAIMHSVYQTSAKQFYRYTVDITFAPSYGTEPDLSGTIVIVGGVAPATFDPTALAGTGGNHAPLLRFLGTA